MKLLRWLVDRGNSAAYFMLGQQLHKCGANEEAAKCLMSASNKGYNPAKALLGEMLIKGEGVGRNIQEGIRLLSQAAKEGNIEAQLTLSKAYQKGEYLPKNPEEAVFWAKQAALQGCEYAQMRVSIYYSFGHGVDRDFRESYFWVYQAARQGFAYAQAGVGECFQEGLGVRQNKCKGAKFYALAAAQGFHFATARLGLCYILGRGVKQDKEKGVTLLRKAAEGGNKFAPIYLIKFGQLKYIPVDAAEIERYEKQLKEHGYTISLSEEPVPIIERRKNWIQTEYDHIELLYYLENDDNAEDDNSVQNPFDPMLNFGRRIIESFAKKGMK